MELGRQLLNGLQGIQAGTQSAERRISGMHRPGWRPHSLGLLGWLGYFRVLFLPYHGTPWRRWLVESWLFRLCSAARTRVFPTFVHHLATSSSWSAHGFEGTAECRSVPGCGGRWYKWRFCFCRSGRASRTFFPRWKEALSMTTTRGMPRSGGRVCRKSTRSSPFQVRPAAHQVRGGAFSWLFPFLPCCSARAASTFTRCPWGLSPGPARRRHQVWVGGRQGLKPVSSRKKRSRAPARAFF